MPNPAVKSRLIHVAACKVCGDPSPETLKDTPFTAPEVWGFLEPYYGGRLAREIFEGARFQVSKCRRCGFIWQSNILDPEGMDLLYGTWIPTEDSLAKKARKPAAYFREYAREVECMSLLVPGLPAETAVLDFGMGWGYWCLMAKAHGYDVTGLEISKDRVEFARGNGIRVVEELSGLAGRTFDFINSEQVFEHLEEPLATLKSAMALLKRGGYLRISVPDGSGVESALRSPGWRAAKDANHPLEHINCYTERSLRALGEAAALKPVPQPIAPRGFRSLLKRAVSSFVPLHSGTAQYFRKP